MKERRNFYKKNKKENRDRQRHAEKRKEMTLMVSDSFSIFL